MALLTIGAPVAFAADGGSAAPIPPSVTQFLDSIARMGVVAPTTGAQPAIGKAQPGALIASSLHLAVSISSAQFGDVSLYAARAQRGVCWVIMRGGKVSGNCAGDNVPTRSPVVVGYDSNPAGWNLVDGHTYSSKARSLVVHFKSGSTMQVPVSGRFFVFELGLDHAAHSQDRPVSLDVRDASGTTLGTRIDPLRLGMRPKALAAIAQTVHLRAQLRLPDGGGHITLSSGRDAAGDACMRVLLGGHVANLAATWQCGPQIGHYDHLLDAKNPRIVHRVPVSWTLGRSGHLVLSSHTFAYGYVAPTIGRLELRYQDGQTARVALHGGFFAYAFPTTAYAAGHRPSLLRAYTASGKLVYTQRLYPKRPCVYPGPDAACGSSSSGTIGGSLVSSNSGGFVMSPARG